LEFISYLRNLDVRLLADGERLRVNAPKGTLTAELRSQIDERKAELLAALCDQASVASSGPLSIPRPVSKDSAPLSFAQERLWFLEQLDPGSTVYNICRVSRLTGELNIAALEASLTEILRRHEILRSQISVIDGRPMQVTAAAPEFKVYFTDLRSLKGSRLDDEIRRQSRAEGEQPFDFSAGLFLRCALLQIRNDQHILILTTHHIVADAWSMGILTQELWTLYDAHANGRSYVLQDLAVQYADYALWQREWLQGELVEVQLSYWRKQLDNLPPLNLSTDHPRRGKQSFRGARQQMSLPESLTKAVNELSGREGVTQFMTLLAAFQVLLYRYSGQEDIVVGSPIANRNRTGDEGLIGFFVNTLVLRADLSKKPTFKECLQRVRDVCLGAYAHQDLPFEKLVEELQPERDLSRSPLFQVMFVLQNTPRRFPQPSGLRIERVEVLSATSAFDLSLYLRERAGKLIGFVEYNTDLFESSTIERMIGHFETLLEGIVADPDQSISTLPLLTEGERHQVLVEWNRTETEYPKDVCIHELFEAQAARTPESIALEFEGKQLTYRQLNRRANQLAHYLRRLEIGPEKLVGICIQRSIEMVIGLLGILKVGGAYVPLDPSYPKERLAFILNDSQVSVLLIHEPIIEGFKRGDSDSRSSILDPQMRMVWLDDNWEAIAGEGEENPRSEIKPDNLAYVIYTSGSTGQPKGVAIEHRNTVALLYWAKSVFSNDELRGVLASTSICFDLSVFELFVPLSYGGKIVLAENALQLYSMPDTNDVTLMNTVPSVITELLAMGNLADSVRTINLAGEPLRSELVKQIHESANAEKVYDLYGPTETTTYSTFTLRTAESPPTIGRPISNTRIYILDENLQPVPIGVPGELYIGGAGVARGYLNRPELTCEKFILDPFRDQPKSRLYRTGDSARYRSDGNIEFLGRADNQVKLRGYRIELGEIEAVLTQHPSVKECVVVLCEHEPRTGKNLVGYLVPREHSVLSVSELRRCLREKLPEYMIPSSFVVLAALPLLPNGKLNRQELPSPDNTRLQSTVELVAPRTESEELIAQIWKEVLKIKKLGIHDNFFELGGHSLLAVQIIARLRDAFNREIPLRVLFEAPTVAALTEKLENIVREGHGPELPPIVPVSRDQPLPLSTNQQHLWQLDRMMPGTHLFNMPYVYQLSGDLKIEALEKALKEIVRRHEGLRTVFADMDGRAVQIIKDGSDFQLPVADLRNGEPDDVSQRAAGSILEEREASFDLTLGPLLRLKLLRLTDTYSLLLITMHHIISDYWSMQIFWRELVVLYDDFSQGRPSSLTDPSIQFADYACWEKCLLDNGLLNEQLSYWKRQLAGPAPQLDFRKDGVRKDAMSFRRTSQPIELDETLFTEIKALCQRENYTAFMVVVTALSIVLYPYAGQQDVRIGALVANRGRRETENTIGHFLNTVILRLQLSPDMSIGECLAQVRTVSIAAHAREELPFEHLTRTLEEGREDEHSSLVQVLLSYESAINKSAQMTGLNLASLDLERREADAELMATSFDMVFRLKELSTRLIGTVNYSDDSVDTSVVAYMLACFRSVLKGMVVDSNESIAASFENE
jgi:amino acid adenylation domain-containing protein